MSRVRNLSRKAKFPTGPPCHEKFDKCLYNHRNADLRNQDEEKLTRMEKTRSDALEMAQEEDAETKATAEDA